MIIIAITITAWLIFRPLARKPRKRTATAALTAPPVISPAEITRREKEREKAEREAEKARIKAEKEEQQKKKRQKERELAIEEYDYVFSMCKMYRERAERLEKAMEKETAQKELARIEKELTAVSEKMFKYDMRRMRLYNKITDNA